MDTNQQRAALQALGIFQLMEHARKAGCQFRNGIDGGKAAIIDLVLARGVGEAVLASAAGRTIGSAPSEPRNQPATPIPTTQPPTTPEQPMHAPTPHPATPSAPDSLADAIRRAIGPVSVTPEQITAIVAPMIDAAIRNALMHNTVSIAQPDGQPPVIIEGGHSQLPALIKLIQLQPVSGLSTMLVGGAGAGKTRACLQAFEAIGLTPHIQGAVSHAHELLGYMDANGKYVRTATREAYEHGGGLLLDENDGSTPEAPLVINALLAGDVANFPDGLVKRHPDFRCVAACNTDGSGGNMQFIGRSRQDGAYLDRFSILQWEVCPKIEKAMSGGHADWLAAVRAIRTLMAEREILDVGATPRALRAGAAFLTDSTFTRMEVLTMTLRKGALRDIWADALRLPAVVEFLSGF